MRSNYHFPVDNPQYAIYFIYAVRELRTASEPLTTAKRRGTEQNRTKQKSKGAHEDMKTERGTAKAAGEQARRKDPREVTREEEIRQRQRSMMNALLCCLI